MVLKFYIYQCLSLSRVDKDQSWRYKELKSVLRRFWFVINLRAAWYSESSALRVVEESLNSQTASEVYR